MPDFSGRSGGGGGGEGGADCVAVSNSGAEAPWSSGARGGAPTDAETVCRGADCAAIGEGVGSSVCVGATPNVAIGDKHTIPGMASSGKPWCAGEEEAHEALPLGDIVEKEGGEAISSPLA